MEGIPRWDSEREENELQLGMNCTWLWKELERTEVL